ncbi:MAG: hypothetical protein WCF44_07485 [Candidatus Methylophosphatis roskildensis]
MSAGEKFFDTNVLLYRLSVDAAKADRAEAELTAGGVFECAGGSDPGCVHDRTNREGD